MLDICLLKQRIRDAVLLFVLDICLLKQGSRDAVLLFVLDICLLKQRIRDAVLLFVLDICLLKQRIRDAVFGKQLFEQVHSNIVNWTNDNNRLFGNTWQTNQSSIAGVRTINPLLTIKTYSLDSGHSQSKR